MSFTPGSRISVPSRPDLGWVTVDDARELDGGAVRLYADTGGPDQIVRLDLTAEQAAACEVLSEDGGGDARALLAGLWTAWMRAAGTGARAATLASSPLTPYAHQMNAVYGAMLPQPRLRFLLADEPGTGKTIMAGLYLREMQRLGFVRSALIVAPAHLVTKWQADFERFFGGGLRAITAQTVREHGLESGHDLWIVSLDLLSVNGAVQDAVHPDRMGWDAVVFDEAHRLTPTAVGYYQAGEMLALNTPRALLMTATPHRGKEWLFRALLHLVDPEVFPAVENNKEPSRQVKPGRVHFLRRMKEDLVDFDGTTKLFKGRRAENQPVRLSSVEAEFYFEALDLVDRYFPAVAVPLAKMVYGKRAASSLHALAETLKRRREGMGTQMPSAAAVEADPDGDDPASADEARIVHEGSRSAKAERKEIEALLGRIGPLVADMEQPASKWDPLVLTCLGSNGIKPGNGEQAVVFTEYADTADWLVQRLRHAGFAARRYSGRDNHHVRDDTRDAFARRSFQVLVSTDAGNEGIDLQTAHVLVNYDIPWSLVRLEQRMGRIHRVGQTRDVELYNLIATDTREGEVLEVLLGNFVTAANQLEGRMFDSLSLVGELVGLADDDLTRVLADTFGDEDQRARALAAVGAVTASRLTEAAKRADEQERALKTSVDISQAVAALQNDQLDRINPAIVEAFLHRASDGGAVKVSPHAAGEGMFTLALPNGGELPPDFAPPGQRRAGTSALVATSGKFLAEARRSSAAVSDAVNLGPSDPPFKALVAYCAEILSPAMFRGAGLVDQTSGTDYDLFAYEADLTEAGGRRKGTWSCLIRVDSAGARPVRWEMLANLTPADSPAGEPHPARAHDAAARAVMEAGDEQERRSRALDDWLRVAQRELDVLPNELTDDIGDRAARIAERTRLKNMTTQRLADLRQMSEVTIGEPRRLAWARVSAAAPPIDPTEADSERISSHLVANQLRAQGYAVSDVHTEQRGYDLHASRGREQRLVEVKGVWRAASSQGVSLTANEVLIATQQGKDYWLYVVDQCHDGSGAVFGVYQDPVRTFGDLSKTQVIVHLPGSALKAARESEEHAPCA
ncbi:Superfamily II DNA or RNA helicase, SNF2 family [Geodermatophilus africanus]|uniref:Superfamily II DNA or RNA helicase, SNF2 family n=1 Tax=Geodermatophilus africanus TaxID=1137993 RepID=A0A1H3KC94_9ACTN|nr:helicase-related protein [Geodermatophilus africanus]SDY49791.1 Superfamily II DNA or RNA helicase, SNF2 family [Geodermatophilus africanus]